MSRRLNFRNSISIEAPTSSTSGHFLNGGLFLESNNLSHYLNDVVLAENSTHYSSGRRNNGGGVFRQKDWILGCGFLSVSLSVKGNDGIDGSSRNQILAAAAAAVNGGGNGVVEDKKKKINVRLRGKPAAMNTTKHLWAGAVAAMVSRTLVAPLERLKLEYMVRGEQKNLFDLIKTIASSQGLRGFWKGNFVNILRTAPFKALNFYAYDSYRKQLLRITGNEDTTNFERLFAGAGAGMTASILCLPLDTIRTRLVAPGGEALGGVIGAFTHIIQTEGFLSLYKGLVPSILSMAPSSAVFYGVYDILKSAYLNSPEGKQRIKYMSQQGEGLNILEQLELGPRRTLLHGAIAGACAEVATYPFEVVRRQLQLQVRANKLSALATCIKIVENGGVSALYAGLIPSLLQVLPSAAISYFVYEFMKIVLKVE
uniref:probable mitochondrial adenine nucleotide transporter BTL3 n=1 Tax=Erigeron canadensis TaxID=72917 RepID=UPI001CB95640|nr:probable mitochondrial adenine nucleotide transporter BTL3 [Erigeron canadensis]